MHPSRKVLEKLGTFLAILALIWLAVGVTFPFVLGEMELTVENVVAWAGYGVISLSFLFFFAFVILGIPLSVLAWALHRTRRRHTEPTAADESHGPDAP
jgi:hypothetical protein